MGKSYGFIEITGVVAAINALDIMCKTADVELASWERKLGGRLVTLIVQGDVSAVTAAVNAAVEQAIKKPASYAVIANPHEEIVKLVELSASRWKKKQQEIEQPVILIGIRLQIYNVWKVQHLIKDILEEIILISAKTGLNNQTLISTTKESHHIA